MFVGWFVHYAGCKHAIELLKGARRYAENKGSACVGLGFRCLQNLR